MRNDESRYNPLCRRRARGGSEGASHRHEHDVGGARNVLHRVDRNYGDGDGESESESEGESESSGSDCDLDAEVHRARVARLRHQREMRGDILRQLNTLEAIRRERETQRALDDEMETVRRRLGEEEGEGGGLAMFCLFHVLFGRGHPKSSTAAAAVGACNRSFQLHTKKTKNAQQRSVITPSPLLPRRFLYLSFFYKRSQIHLFGYLCSLR